MVSPHLQQCLEILERATKDCGPNAAVRRDSRTWSAVEVVEHLQRAYHGPAKGLERCLANAKPMATPPTLKQRVQSFVLLELGYFPEGRQAPKRVFSIVKGRCADRPCSSIRPIACVRLATSIPQ